MHIVTELQQSLPHDDYRQIAQLWALRITRWKNTITDFRAFHHESMSAVNYLIGLAVEPTDFFKKPELFVSQVIDRLDGIEAAPPPMTGPLFDNVRLIGNFLGFSSIEEQILVLRVMAAAQWPLKAVLGGIENCDGYLLARALSAALMIAPGDILRVLRPDAALFSTGLIRYSNYLQDPIEKLSLRPGLPNILLTRHKSFEELCARFVGRTAPPTLSLPDFDYITDKVRLLVAYLEAIKESRSSGHNVLLYGPPGTGKTELARLAAKTAGVGLYEGEVAGHDGEPLDVNGRLLGLVLLQALVRSIRRGAVLFDEVEDVFKPRQGPEPENRAIAAADSKGWTVRLLENNPAPTIWISNRVAQIDPAILRRFDLVLEIPVAPFETRRSILSKALGRLDRDDSGIERIVRVGAPAPALLTRAARVVSLLGDAESGRVAPNLWLTLQGYLGAQGQDTTDRDFVEGLPFDGSFLNAVPRPESVVETLREYPAARLLITGPSGCGKTAFAHDCAKRIDQRLIHTTTRDLMGNSPRETEWNVRRAFESARQDEAILLLDQMDWLLWISNGPQSAEGLLALNELCACLDSHPGAVVCTTIVGPGIEPRVVRRFRTRIRLDHLRSNQLPGMLAYALRGKVDYLGDEASKELGKFGARLVGIGPLTPGDFVAARSSEGKGVLQGVEALIACLEEGQRLKAGRVAAPIGFRVD